MIDMTDEQKHEFIQNWHNLWIEPEISRRFGIKAYQVILRFGLVAFCYQLDNRQLFNLMMKLDGG